MYHTIRNPVEGTHFKKLAHYNLRLVECVQRVHPQQPKLKPEQAEKMLLAPAKCDVPRKSKLRLEVEEQLPCLFLVDKEARETEGVANLKGGGPKTGTIFVRAHDTRVPKLGVLRVSCGPKHNKDEDEQLNIEGVMYRLVEVICSVQASATGVGAHKLEAEVNSLKQLCERQKRQLDATTKDVNLLQRQCKSQKEQLDAVMELCQKNNI